MLVAVIRITFDREIHSYGMAITSTIKSKRKNYALTNGRELSVKSHLPMLIYRTAIVIDIIQIIP